jgi:two-component system, sensor histidine kinase PdtaS
VKRILTSRLPERLSGALPPLATEFAIGILAPVLFLALRLLLHPLTGSAAPFALSFLAVVLAALVAGWRAGVLALVLGQLLTWFFIVEPRLAFGPLSDEAFYSLLMASISEAVILLIIALYQREVARQRERRRRRIHFLAQALREIDHRTQNNFQTVLSLIHLQSSRSANPDVKAALQEASDRVKALSLVYEKLALSSEGLASIRLHDHLAELTEQIGRGMVGDGISLRTAFVPATVGAEQAVCIGIIANELITNALKHAFADGGGTIHVSTELVDSALVLRVADDGNGMPAKPPRKGLGTRLVDTFVRQLGARHELGSSKAGTEHRIVVPGFNHA